MFEGDPTERSVFWPEQRVAMLPERIAACAKGPAETLADELAGGFRSLRPGDGLFVVADAPQPGGGSQWSDRRLRRRCSQ